MEHLPLSVRVPIEVDNPSICRKRNYVLSVGNVVTFVRKILAFTAHTHLIKRVEKQYV